MIVGEFRRGCRAGLVIDGAGVAAIVAGVVAAILVAIARFRRQEPDVYTQFRQWLGRSILLGLELLVAADIIRTVAAKPTLTNVAVLAAIVLIRTFLSFSLELEITGRWPWQTRLASLRPGLGSPWTQPPSASGCGDVQ